MTTRQRPQRPVWPRPEPDPERNHRGANLCRAVLAGRVKDAPKDDAERETVNSGE